MTTESRQLNPAWFCAIVLAVALVLFAVPFPAPGQLKRLTMIARSDAKIAIVGPSTVFFVSICDRDTRKLSTMIADGSGRKVLDLSVGGQEMAESINLAAATVHNAAITDVILPLAYPQTTDWAVPPYRQLMFYKAVTPGFKGYEAQNLSEFWKGVSDAPRAFSLSYTFEGRTYPEYNVLAATRFSKERQLARCPEPETHDPVFTRSYFWWTHLGAPANPSIPALIADLQATLKAAGKRLHVVMLPSNFEMIDRLRPEWVGQIKARQEGIVGQIRGRGVPVLDLTEGYRADQFGSPWCACAHLNESGRRQLSETIVTAIAGRSPPAADRPRAAVSGQTL